MYKLTVGGFQGTTTDPMAYQNGMYFTTTDSDNDKNSSSNCALLPSPTEPNDGWWHNDCSHINLNNYYKYGSYEIHLKVAVNRKLQKFMHGLFILVLYIEVRI